MLSLAGGKPPDFYQGEPFLGGFRGRMDERYDCVRSVRDGRHVYVWNYMSHKICDQHLDYIWEPPTAQV